MKSRLNTSLILTAIAMTCLLAASVAAQERISYEGENGFKQSFLLSGGQYKLYVYVRDPITGLLPQGFDSCTFSGLLERVSPSYDKLSLGSDVRISQYDWSPWKIDREVSLVAGRYTLSIPSATDCKWTFDLEPKTDPETARPANASLTNDCFLRNCVMPPIALSVGAAGDPAQSVSLQGDMVEFVAPFVRRSASVQPSGICLIKQGDKTLKQQALQVDQDPVKHHDHFYVIETWDKNATPYTGKIRVEFVTNVGNSSAEFTVTR